MKRPSGYPLVIVLLAFLFTACTGLAPTQAPSPLPTNTPSQALPSDTATLRPTASPTATQTVAAATPTQTPLPLPTFPLKLTQTPGIQETATAYVASVTADYLNNLSLMGPMADLLAIEQYFNPVGTPSSSWHNVPIMPQATAGQEFKADIYSYKATATLSMAAAFYDNQAVKLNWSCNYGNSTGYGGTGSNADHSVTKRCQGTIVEMTSFDNDTSHVIVVIDKAP